MVSVVHFQIVMCQKPGNREWGGGGGGGGGGECPC